MARSFSFLVLLLLISACGKPGASDTTDKTQAQGPLTYTDTTCQDAGTGFYFKVVTYSSGYVDSVCRTGAGGGTLAQTEYCDVDGHDFSAGGVDGAAWPDGDCTTTTGTTD